MSMNLHCNKHDLWQTPSHITHMALMTHNGYASSARGKKAKRALLIYAEWVKSTSPSAYTEGEKEYVEQRREAIRTEVMQVLAVINETDLEVCMF